MTTVCGKLLHVIYPTSYACLSNKTWEVRPIHVEIHVILTALWWRVGAGETSLTA